MNEPTELPEYVKHADCKEDGDRIFKQFQAASTSRKDIPCRCGSRATVAMMFRCYACGEWFCKRCAAEHFNIDLVEYRKQKAETCHDKIEDARS